MFKGVFRIFILFACISVIFSSCKNDLEVNADWKEKMIVYGLLNQSDSVHYIKINKAFLGKSNALTMAQVSDSTTYGRELQVTLEKWNNGTYIESYTLNRDSSIAKEAGIFSSPKQILYRLDKKLDQKYEYRLKALNTKSGVSVSSKTKLVRDFYFPKPTASQTNFTYTVIPVEITWTSPEYASLNQLIIRFYYNEIDKISKLSTLRYVDWFFSTRKTDAGGGNAIKESFWGEQFFTFLNGKMKVNNDVDRYAARLEFMVSAAASEFDVYMQVSKPSTGIVQEKGQYTNIENGWGIFSSRYTKTISAPWNSFNTKELVEGEHTKHLGFKY